MINFRNVIHFIRTNYNRHGLLKATISVLYKILNRVIGFNCLIAITLHKDQFQKKKSLDSSNHCFRYATEEDLRKLQETNEFEISDYDIKALKNGERCLLHFVENELAGYTWIHPWQSPNIMNVICLKIPKNMVYNYKGFTHPKFRGKGFQSVRYHRIINDFVDQSKTCLLGYVEMTNWSSRKGQKKGGYVSIGRLYYMKLGKLSFGLLSKNLRNNGIDINTYKYKFNNFYIFKKEIALT